MFVGRTGEQGAAGAAAAAAAPAAKCITFLGTVLQSQPASTLAYLRLQIYLLPACLLATGSCNILEAALELN